jgi:hypothetical protein
MSLILLITLLLTACAEGRWVHSVKTEAQSREDWEICKREVLSGQEHAKDTMAGGINLSGCMQSKGYRYIEQQPSQQPNADIPAPH